MFALRTPQQCQLSDCLDNCTGTADHAGFHIGARVQCLDASSIFEECKVNTPKMFQLTLSYSVVMSKFGGFGFGISD